ncbi:MAG: helix-turn-helix transcriptional regulator [Actinomycetota bacterium]|nr:helix-turn-helix transcriptional regulator [Actinomycetota bacterium]
MRGDQLPTAADGTVRLCLEIDLDREPITGTLSAPDEAPSRFMGWIGLTAALEGLRRGSRPRGRRRPGKGWPILTPTERKVIELVCEGHSNPEIARRLSVSPRTIQAHLTNVYRKLAVGGRTELVALAMRREMGGEDDEARQRQKRNPPDTSD